jgi:hypothetical protein
MTVPATTSKPYTPAEKPKEKPAEPKKEVIKILSKEKFEHFQESFEQYKRSLITKRK